MHMFSACLCIAVLRAVHAGDDGNKGLHVGHAGVNNRGHAHGGSCTADPEAPVVVSLTGSFRGSCMTSRRGRTFEAYRGIRYAEPPVGILRFQPPKPIHKYWHVVNASEDGPSCPQPINPGRYYDEDCLRLNVYTPRRNSSKLPVVVFIHQGGLYSASSRSDIIGPQYLMDRDIVLVTINYRLGSLGFLSTGDAYAPGNNGFKDQVAALRWVQRNIAAFGGDPTCVTIAGYSSGSYSVALHMVSPMSRGLFHRAISMSGSPYSQIEIPYHQRHLAEKQARLVGCPTDNSRVILDCLKSVPWRDIGNSLGGFAEFAFDPVRIWRPVIEQDFGQEVFMPRHPLEALRLGQLYAVPYIVSQTRDEFFWKAFTILQNATLTQQMNDDWYRVAKIAFMLPEDSRTAAYKIREAYFKGKPVVNDTVTTYSLGRLYGDAVTGFGAHRLANIMCRVSPQSVYYYQFSYIGNHSFYEDPITKKPVGVAHHDDLIYLFSIRVRFPDIGLSGPDAALVDKMTAIWYNFARYGDPNPRPATPELATLHWPAMTSQSRRYLRLANNFTILHNQAEDRFQLWDQLFPLLYNTWILPATIVPFF
ncbi:juvenile hormone esterase-like [Epargyreus clarus]|uniref:juvenile hormone esterase-like n=1 Tax=Epargyreus clarus TaxID=520877 RepID=UPI003C30CCA9